MGGSPPAKGELRFNLLGFPVRVQPFFWLTAVFLGASAGGPAHIGAWVAVVFVSVLVHELGHAMAARLFGSPARIMLYGLGGLTVHRPMSSQWRSIAVSIAGPFAGFALAAVTFGVAVILPASPGIVETLFQFLLFVNVGWGVVNLLPVLPLDGGHVARSAFRSRRRTGDLSGPDLDRGALRRARLVQHPGTPAAAGSCVFERLLGSTLEWPPEAREIAPRAPAPSKRRAARRKKKKRPQKKTGR
jgi:membrane-associated protease RseP (regulator of RpoE activity)